MNGTSVCYGRRENGVGVHDIELRRAAANQGPERVMLGNRQIAGVLAARPRDGSVAAPEVDGPSAC